MNTFVCDKTRRGMEKMEFKISLRCRRLGDEKNRWIFYYLVSIYTHFLQHIICCYTYFAYGIIDFEIGLHTTHNAPLKNWKNGENEGHEELRCDQCQ